MPKIKAYAKCDTLIAVDDAAVIDAYRCPWTDDLFRYKSDYVQHLADIRESKIRRKIRMNNRDKILNKVWNLRTFNEIVEWFNTNPKLVLEYANRRRWINDKEIPPDEYKFEITYLKLRWSSKVSNSHSCPHNGVQNFGRDLKFKNGTPYPTGYPGWEGNIEFKTSHDIGWSSDLLGSFRIHTGTGGGSGINRPAGYQVRFFDADWHGLAAQTEKEYDSYSNFATMERLKDNDVIPFNQTFQFGTPHYFRH